MSRKLLILVIAVIWPHIVLAADEPAPVNLLVGRSAVVDVGATITRVSLTSAEIADALVTAPDELLVNGKTPGTVSMFVWDRGGSIRRYEVVVQRDLSRLGEQMKTFFPGENIAVEGNGRNVVLSGSVTNKDVIEKAVDLATGYVEKRDEVVTLLQIQEGAPSNQVLLRVRFAEVSRSALTELGASFFTSPLGINNTLGRVTTQQFAAPGFGKLEASKESLDFGADVKSASGEFTFSDFLNLFLFSEKYDLGAMIKLLQTRGLFQSLAEPNLVAESGKEASFLAGGEIPIPIAQGTGGNVAISVQYKEFGIRLNFTPQVNGDRIHLKVRPEVSSLDFNNAVVLQGFRVPALSTRRTETELELRDGQTFAIAGLLSNSMMESLQKVPGLGDIPILGYLFRSKAAQKERTELVVMITPEILPNNSNGVTDQLPRQREPYLPPLSDRESIAPPAAAFPRQGGASASVAPAAPAAPNAAAAAAAVSALTPGGPKMATAPQNTASAAGAPDAQPNPAGDPALATTPAQIGDDPAADDNLQDVPPASDATQTMRPLTQEELARIQEAQQAEAEARERHERDRRAADGTPEAR